MSERTEIHKRGDFLLHIINMYNTRGHKNVLEEALKKTIRDVENNEILIYGFSLYDIECDFSRYVSELKEEGLLNEEPFYCTLTDSGKEYVEKTMIPLKSRRGYYEIFEKIPIIVK